MLRVMWIREYRRGLLRARVVESTEHARVLAGLQLNTVVDIGANRGQFALCVRRLYPQAQIFSFEPLSKPALSWTRLFESDPRAALEEGDRGPIWIGHIACVEVGCILVAAADSQGSKREF